MKRYMRRLCLDKVDDWRELCVKADTHSVAGVNFVSRLVCIWWLA